MSELIGEEADRLPCWEVDGALYCALDKKEDHGGSFDPLNHPADNCTFERTHIDVGYRFPSGIIILHALDCMYTVHN